MNIKLAWRNIWRNRKRTLISLSSVSLAVVLAVFTRSFQEGSYAKMIENSVGQLTGYINVHQAEYWKEKSLDNGITVSDSLINTIETVDGVTAVDPKIESFSLVAHGNHTKGALVAGIDPDSEDEHVKLSEKIVEGRFIKAVEKGIVLGEGLSKYLKINIGDTLVMMGQGHYGQSAVGAYPVVGIVKLPSPELNKQLVYMPLNLARTYLSFDDGATSLIVRIDDQSRADEINRAINNKIDTTQYLSMTWEEMSPELVQMIEGDKSGGIIMIGILYMIIAFGIFGTILMMTEERKKEFAMMIALGMQKSKIIIISIYETLYINSLGLIIGTIITLPLVVFFNIYPIRVSGEMAASIEQFGMEPVMPTLVDFDIFWEQIVVVLLIIGIAALYPIISIVKLQLIKALRK
ncbi:MAG: ABC transporter permease [Bacteroidales bacterium]|nr:ABC transporter permease [Bacteroidales bacterium]